MFNQPDDFFDGLLTNSYNAGTGILSLSWPAGEGWRLQVQTNGLNSTNWFDLPNPTQTNLLQIPISPDNGSVFFRLIYP